jgi:hypothetical protein
MAMSAGSRADILRSSSYSALPSKANNPGFISTRRPKTKGFGRLERPWTVDYSALMAREEEATYAEFERFKRELIEASRSVN